MIIGVDKEGYIVSIGILYDKNAFSTKVIEKRNLNIITNDYKYENGKIIDLGLKDEFRKTEEEKIKEELKELDKTINRATEDLYELTDTKPYKSTEEVIERKKELRQQLKNINEVKTEEEIDTSSSDVSTEISE